MPNETPPEVVARILEMTEQYPMRSYLFVSQQPKLVGVGVSAAVRAVWARHGLTLRHQRLLWLKQKTAARGGVLTEAQARLLHQWQGKSTDPQVHIEAPQSGFLLCQDRYCVGTDQGRRADLPAIGGRCALLAGVWQAAFVEGAEDGRRCTA